MTAPDAELRKLHRRFMARLKAADAPAELSLLGHQRLRRLAVADLDKFEAAWTAHGVA